MRIECNNIFDIVSYGLKSVVRAAIPLGYGQVDLSVKAEGVKRVRDCFTDQTPCRLLSKDPLFIRRNGKSYAEDAHHALHLILARYISAEKQPDTPQDAELVG